RGAQQREQLAGILLELTEAERLQRLVAAHGEPRLDARHEKRDAGRDTDVEGRVDGADLDRRPSEERRRIHLEPAAGRLVVERSLRVQVDVTAEDVRAQLERDAGASFLAGLR